MGFSSEAKKPSQTNPGTQKAAEKWMSPGNNALWTEAEAMPLLGSYEKHGGFHVPCHRVNLKHLFSLHQRRDKTGPIHVSFPGAMPGDTEHVRPLLF